MCIRDDQGAFVLACIEWYSPILEVGTWDVLELLHVMKWVTNLQLVDMDFEVDSKKVVDSIYGGKDSVSYFGAIINDRR